MRYRRVTYRYEMAVRSGRPWPFGDVWQGERLRLLAQGQWRPDADTCETAGAIEITIELAGIDEDAVEVQLFEDAVVVEGYRRLVPCEEGGVYHAAAIRQGPFRVECLLPARVDADRVEARYERGLLRINLPKRAGDA